MLYHNAMRSRSGCIIFIGGAEVLVSLLKSSIIYIPVLFLDVIIPIEDKFTQLATNVIRTYAQTSYSQLLQSRA